MPLTIVRNDITNMCADAIVNTANPLPEIGWGVDAGIHKKAGPQLLEARRKLGHIGVGRAAMTPAFGLDAKYVIHTVGPVWHGGSHDEEALLRRCYREALELALSNGCESIAFPLLSSGNHGFPKPLALQVAISTFSRFLLEHEMQIWLVVFGRESFALSEKLFRSVESYIDENYIHQKKLDEYGVADKCAVRGQETAAIRAEMERRRQLRFRQAKQAEERYAQPTAPCPFPTPAAASIPAESVAAPSLENLLAQTDAGFSETLLRLIDRTGEKDSDVYKRANVDRKLFSKIRNNPAYKPSKTTALAFAVALKLSLDETRDFIARAGYALTHSSKLDIIVEYFILQKNYDIMEINEVLFAFDQALLGS